MKKTPPEHPDYDNLVIAKQKFLELSDHVDRDLADFKALEKCMQLASELVFKKKEKVNCPSSPLPQFSPFWNRSMF